MHGDVVLAFSRNLGVSKLEDPTPNHEDDSFFPRVVGLESDRGCQETHNAISDVEPRLLFQRRLPPDGDGAWKGGLSQVQELESSLVTAVFAKLSGCSFHSPCGANGSFSRN